MPPDPRFQQTIADWQTRLLQLDRRNNLINFKPNRAVTILNRTPDGLADELLRARSGLRFDYIEPHRRTDELPDQPDIRGDLDTDLPLGELQRRLSRLRKRDKEFEEEQGLNVLFVAMGVLHWIDEDGETTLSPLLLIPCDLERASPRDPFRLRREDDDATDNATLRHKLGLAGIALPEFADMAPNQYFAAVEAAVRTRREWRVTPDTYLATFAYSKLAMWAGGLPYS